jgi:hypothetical protein
MDKARYPHVTRTWRVERTKVYYREPQAGRRTNLGATSRRQDRVPYRPPRQG